MYFVVCHLVAYAVVVLFSTLIWPQVSSNQFLLELRYCTLLCRELFLLLSLKLDTEIIPHEADERDNIKLLKKKKKEKDIDKQIKDLEYEYLVLLSISFYIVKFDECRYSKKLIRLGRLLKESKWESWNAEKVAEYEKMMEVMERLLRQLVR